jgi:hypothetical protein
VELGISLEAQAEKIRAIALVQGAELSEIIVESGESAKGLNRPGMAKLLAMGGIVATLTGSLAAPLLPNAASQPPRPVGTKLASLHSRAS